MQREECLLSMHPLFMMNKHRDPIRKAVLSHFTVKEAPVKEMK